VHVDGVGTTELAGEFRPDRAMGEPMREILQRTIDRGYQDFIGHVAKARKKDVAAIDAIAQGRVWSGADAKRLGLVDEIGGYQDAIKLAAKLAKLGKEYEVIYDDREPGFGEALGLRVRSALASVMAPLLPKGALPTLPRSLAPVVAEMQRIERLADPRNVFAYCFACSPTDR
jgi:protease-4